MAQLSSPVVAAICPALLLPAVWPVGSPGSVGGACGGMKDRARENEKLELNFLLLLSFLSLCLPSVLAAPLRSASRNPSRRRRRQKEEEEEEKSLSPQPAVTLTEAFYILLTAGRCKNFIYPPPSLHTHTHPLCGPAPPWMRDSTVTG